MNAAGTVYVVDDDLAVREALASLVRSMDLEPRLFANAAEFLAAPRAAGPACLVLDVMMPGLSGLGLQELLAGTPDAPPIIFITGHGDIPTSVRAMKAGAVEFLPKPFKAEDLARAIEEALERDLASRTRDAELADVRARFEALSPREREVALRVVQGRLNKQIAGELGISEDTVKVHRRHIMQKLGMKSVTDLVRAASRVGLTGA